MNAKKQIKQTDIVRNYLKNHKWIDRGSAFRIGIANLTSVIDLLRKEGEIIEFRDVKHTNQYGGKTHYRQYRIGA